MLNLSLKKFRQNHKNGKNQILYISHKADGDKQIENLTNNLLYKKNTFIEMCISVPCTSLDFIFFL